ncbi:MAG: helix-turn-helix domain-containing protein [Firmicutes bacterium]|nr:helix-turn-helix domain-containing protein [Bacillota bacterium]
MRTLEDWFKYLEQQYVDEKKQEESRPSSEPASPRQEPASSEQAAGRVVAPAVQQPRREELPRERPAKTPPALEQVRVTEAPVPDPADYIFTIRRAAVEPPATAAKPATTAETEETARPVEPAEQESDTKRAVAQPAAPPVQEQEEAVAETPVPEVSEPPAETVSPETAVGRKERPQSAKPVKRAPYTRSVRPVPPPQSIEELWKRVPKHVRLLVELGDDEVTQKYYDRQFKESRQELVERLLNPSLTLEDTARLLGVCPTTVRRYTERGLLNHYRTPGNQRRFRLSDVIAFLEARQQAQEARRRKR